MRRRPRDHGRIACDLRHHRGRGGEAPRRRVPRHLPDAGQPRPRDPAPDHGADRHHAGHGAARSPDRGGLAGVARVHRRRRHRRPQRPVRPELPAGGHAPDRAAPAHQSLDRHLRPGPSAGAGRGAEPQARHALVAFAVVAHADAPRPRRRAGHRRSAARHARAGCGPGGHGARRPPGAAHDERPRASRQVETDDQASRGRRVSICSAIVTGACSMWARRQTFEHACARTSRGTNAERSVPCSARHSTSIMSCAVIRSKPRYSRFGSSTSTCRASTAG